jgi:ribosome-binding protein aMBF1 (putative translation factor)
MNMTTETKRDLIAEGEQDYQAWRASLTDTPEKQAKYAEIAAKSDLWLQLVEARQAAGLSQRDLAKRLGVSQAQVARLEKRGYDAHSVNSLRRYVEALGEGFSLEVRVHHPESPENSHPAAVESAASVLAP